MKRSHRTLLCILLLALFLLTIFPVSPAFADEEYPETPVEEEPYTGLTRFYASLSFSNGYAICNGSVCTESGYSAFVTLTLKEDNETVATWSKTVSSISPNNPSGQYAAVHGKTYQLVMNALVFKSGVIVDTPSYSTQSYCY